MECVENLNSIRPTTKAEIEMAKSSVPHHTRFINEEMELSGNEKDISRDLDYVFEEYKNWHKICAFGSKVKDKNVFSKELNRLG